MSTMEKLYTLMDEYEKTFGTAFSLFLVSPDPDEAAQTAQRCLNEHKDHRGVTQPHIRRKNFILEQPFIAAVFVWRFYGR